MGGGKIDIVLHICMVRKKIAQNYKKTSTYAIRTCRNLRKVPFLGHFFTQTTLRVSIFPHVCKKNAPEDAFLGFQIVRVIDLEFKIIHRSKAMSKR